MTLTRISRLTQDTMETARTVLSAGGLIVCPTDTVYGFLVDASSDEAVRKLIALKERPVGKAISVFVDGPTMMDTVVDTSCMTASPRSLLPGPYTMVLPSRGQTSPLLESEKGTLGVRWIGEKINSKQETVNKLGVSPMTFVTELVSRFGRPVTATSANLAGKPACYSITALMHQLSEKKKALIDLVIDGGDLPHHAPSTVLDLTTPTPQVLRAGGESGRVFLTRSPEETMQVAESLIGEKFQIPNSKFQIKNQIPIIKNQTPHAPEPLVIYLHGDLGAGKTQFVKGIARYLGFTHVVSPTYVGVQEYVNGRVKLYHVDLYNYPTKEDIESLRLAELIAPGSIVCIEWSEIAPLAYLGVHVYIEYITETQRKIRLMHY